MNYAIKNWAKFQHFKDRRPPWIKLYRDILDDQDWHDLDGDSAKTLVALWLLASEDANHNGALPDVRNIAFRLRQPEAKIKQSLTKLSHWLERDDIKTISRRYQDDIKTISHGYHGDTPETERETETKVEREGEPECPSSPDGDLTAVVAAFDSFWLAYPKKVGKAAARTAWVKAKASSKTLADIESALAWQVKSDQWCKDHGQYIPNPATYLSQHRWQDEPVKTDTSLTAVGRRAAAAATEWLKQEGVYQ